MLQVTYQVEPSDVKAFQAHARAASPEFRRLRLYVLLISMATGLYSAWNEEAQGIRHRIFFFVFTTGVVWLFITLSSLLLRGIVQFKSAQSADIPGVLGAHTITLNEESFTEVTAVNETTAKWAGTHLVDTTPTHIFIYTQPSSAHTIPRRAFASPELAEQFAAFAKAHHERSKMKA